MKKTPFTQLIDQYDVILFDSYGVLKNYKGLIRGVKQTFEVLEQKKKRYRILDNDASSGQDRLARKFKNSGLNIKPEHIITSGMMATNFLRDKKIEGKVLFLGTEFSSEHIISAQKSKINVTKYNESKIDEIGCVIFLDDEGYDWNTNLNKVVNLLRKKSIPVIVANSDLTYPISKNDVSLSTGALAKIVEKVLGRKFVHFGKPDIQMFSHAFDDLKRDLPFLEKKNMLMVGDTLQTDILGATKFGIDTALVLSGNTSTKDFAMAIRSSGISPDYICESIVL